MYAPITGWYTFGNETGMERAQNSFLSGEDDRLFVNRLVDLVNGNATKGGNVLLTIDPAAQKAAFDGLRALGSDVQGAVVAIEPSTGKVLAMVSLPSYDPNKLARPRLQEGQRLRHPALQDEVAAAAQPGRPDDPPARIDVQDPDRRGGHAVRRLHRELPGARRPDATRLPQSTNIVHNEVPGCAPKITAHAGAEVLVQHRLRARWR